MMTPRPVMPPVAAVVPWRAPRPSEAAVAAPWRCFRTLCGPRGSRFHPVEQCRSVRVRDPDSRGPRVGRDWPVRSFHRMDKDDGSGRFATGFGGNQSDGAKVPDQTGTAFALVILESEEQ